MSKLTHVRRERIAQNHCKNHMKMKIFIPRMHHHASSFSLENHKKLRMKMRIAAEVDFR